MSLSHLVRIRPSVVSVGSRFLSTPNLPAALPASTQFHSLVGNSAVSAKLHVPNLSFLPQQVNQLRWDSSSPPPPPDAPGGAKERDRWDRWQENQAAKKRFSNEGYEYRSVFTRKTADELWKGVTTVSNAAKKSSRGKRGKKIRRTDLNQGQVGRARGRNLIGFAPYCSPSALSR